MRMTAWGLKGDVATFCLFPMLRAQVVKMGSTWLQRVVFKLFSVLGICSVFAANAVANCPSPRPNGMLACMDFEDWTGDVDTTPGYLFGLYNSPSNWALHKSRTRVLQSCNAWQAYSGDYFFYGNWFDGHDICLNATAGSPILFLGRFEDLGNNPKFMLADSSTDILYLRFKVKLGAGWKVNTNHMVKFVRTKWTGGRLADFYSNVIMYEGKTNSIYAPGASESLWHDGVDLDTVGIDLSDGQWHDFALLQDISKLHTAHPDSLHVKIWVDNKMVKERDVATNLDYILNQNGVAYEGIQLLENFCGTTNDGPVPFAFDDIEIWDGAPTDPEPDRLAPAAPSNLVVN